MAHLDCARFGGSLWLWRVQLSGRRRQGGSIKLDLLAGHQLGAVQGRLIALSWRHHDKCVVLIGRGVADDIKLPEHPEGALLGLEHPDSREVALIMRLQRTANV